MAGVPADLRRSAARSAFVLFFGFGCFEVIVREAMVFVD
jgi:hypothetical protein